MPSGCDEMALPSSLLCTAEAVVTFHPDLLDEREAVHVHCLIERRARE
jgi:hypothetical protein